MIILIDDDKLIRLSWKLRADKLSMDFNHFESVASFIENESVFERNVKIYIDSDLGDELKGEKEALKLHALGFTDINMATGHSAEDLELPSFIRSVIGKKAPF